MTKNEGTRQLLIKHYLTYPELKPQDIFKFLHQSSFGCEHMVSSAESAADLLLREAEGLSESRTELTEALDGEYSRVSLWYTKQGLSTQTLAKLFFLSARREDGGAVALEEKLETAAELVNEGILPFDKEVFSAELGKWKSNGYPALHHSDEFRAAYSPAYRVISNKFIPFLPLFAMLDRALEKGEVRLAVEGGSASGKTTLGNILNEVYGCALFHMDDFFLRPEQRTPERFAEPGGNVDRERFLAEVLIPLSRGESVSYRRFDCSTFELMPPVGIRPTRLTVTEGAYSMHPALAPYYDLSVFIDISPTLQRSRILKRNSPEMAKRFFEEWIPLEQRYFETFNIKGRCNAVIAINE